MQSKPYPELHMMSAHDCTPILLASQLCCMLFMTMNLRLLDYEYTTKPISETHRMVV